MKKFTRLLFASFLALGLGVNAQQEGSQGPYSVTTAETVTVVSSIASRMNTIAPARAKEGPVQDGRASKNIIIPGKGSDGPDALAQNQHRSANTLQGRTPSLVFETTQQNSQPTDPAGAVGPNHYFAVFNTGVRIFDKLGNPLTGNLGAGAIFPASGCCDLTVSYDNLADRWVVSFLGNGVQVAVSTTNDPVTTDWVVYNFPTIADYNKLSVNHNGYYITQNGEGGRVHVLERDAALAGDANAQMTSFLLPGLVTSGFNSSQAFNITDDNHPSADSTVGVVYLQDDAWNGVTSDHVKLWEIDVDWDNVASSTVSGGQEIALTPFISVFDNGSFVNLQQPNGGTSVDALQATIMNQAQFRKFPTHNSAIFNFVVDTDATAGELAGIRWVELRQATDDGPWSLYQEGTHTSPDGKHAWHGSMAMDAQGNIGLGYTSMAGPTTPTDGSVDVVLSSYYTGRFAGDALGTMTVTETLIAKGSGNIPSTRYGDYGKMDVDPNNDKEFWFLNEYVGPSGRANVVGVFQIAPDFPDDIGVTSIDTPNTGTLTATEEVTVTIFNFGENEASGFDVTYQVDGGAVVTESFTGTIASATSATFTFAATADLSTVGEMYSIVASTVYPVDQDDSNNSVTKIVTHLDPIDVGISAITSPVSGSGLSDAETVTVVIENYGGETQTSIPVYFALDAGAPVQETYTGSIASGETDTYTFTATVDLSELGDYVLVAGTEMVGDAIEGNDDFEAEVSNFICQPESNCAGFDDGVTQLTLADQDITVDCGATSVGYSDNTDIVFNFVLEDNPFTGTLQMGFADSIYAIWIDFNDNNSFEADELISSEQVATADTDFTFTIDFSTIPTTATGMHRMRVRGEDESTTGDVLDVCGDLAFGRTNDYTANITGMLLSVQDEDFAQADFSVVETTSKIYDIDFVTSFDGTAGLRVYNMLGQEIVYHNMTKEGDRYSYNLDMNYVASGVYIVQVGTLDGTSVRTKKIVVR